MTATANVNGKELEFKSGEWEEKTEKKKIKKEIKLVDKKEGIKGTKNIEKNGEINITPKKDFILVNGYWRKELKEGVPISIPSKYKSSLETEGVI